MCVCVRERVCVCVCVYVREREGWIYYSAGSKWESVTQTRGVDGAEVSQLST